VRPERAPEDVSRGRIAHNLALQGRRDVALRVAGRHQHHRHGRHRGVPTLGQLRPRLVDGGRRELDEPTGHVHVEQVAHAAGERDELLDAGRVDRAVPDEQQGRCHQSTALSSSA
jgi:hypothetical protein